MNKFIEKNFSIFLVLLGIVLFFPYLGHINLFDWDEANFAELAREMVLTKNYLQPQINYLPFYEKPPVFIWMQVASMKAFGINEFAARFPNALLGILVILSLYWIGCREKDQRFGRIWVMTYIGSLLPFLYFRTGLIDPWFNYLMFISLYFYYISVKELNSKNKKFIISALSLGLAVQTKGPVALIIVSGTLGIVWILSKFKFFLGWGRSIVWVILTLVFSSFWFLYETYAHGTNYIYEFFIYQIRLFTTEDALHGGPFYYHFIVLLLGCFPASFILLFKTNWKENWRDDWFKIMFICGLFVLILFSIVQTKIIHYSSMAYYPISYLAALYLSQRGNYCSKIERFITHFFISFLLLSLLLFPVLGVNIEKLIPIIQDRQTASQLNTYVEWKYVEVIWGILLFILYISFSRVFKSQDSRVRSFILSPLIVIVLMVVFAPKIERYTQGEYIDFCREIKGQEADIQTLYIKSYAVHYYSEKKPFINLEDTFKHLYYLYLPIKRPAYFIAKAKDTSRISGFTPFRVRNGFAFYRREP